MGVKTQIHSFLRLNARLLSPLSLQPLLDDVLNLPVKLGISLHFLPGYPTGSGAFCGGVPRLRPLSGIHASLLPGVGSCFARPAPLSFREKLHKAHSDFFHSSSFIFPG